MKSQLAMADVAELLAKQGVRYEVIDAMAAAVQRGCARQPRWRRRTGDVDDPIPALLEVKDGHGNRVDLLIGLRGMDPEMMNRTRQARLAEAILEVVGGEDFIAMKAFAGGPFDLADARAVIDPDPESLDLDLLRPLAQRFGRDTTRTVEDLIGAVD